MLETIDLGVCSVMLRMRVWICPSGVSLCTLVVVDLLAIETILMFPKRTCCRLMLKGIYMFQRSFANFVGDESEF